MTLVFQDLCIDTNDPQVTADFWAPTLDLRIEPNDDTFVLRGDRSEETLWINLVPQTKQAKARVHLDVNLLSLDEVLDRGARVLDDSHRWTVCATPDDVEFCAFLRTPDEIAGHRPLYEVVVDSVDPERICRWWAEAYGVTAEHDPAHPWWWLGGAERVGLEFGMVFVPVPEAKVMPNWIHWDVVGDTEELLAAGATLFRRRDHEIRWDVLTDPEGNEFCVFTR